MSEQAIALREQERIEALSRWSRLERIRKVAQENPDLPFELLAERFSRSSRNELLAILGPDVLNRRPAANRRLAEHVAARAPRGNFLVGWHRRPGRSA